jgi:hypothetical protein
MPAGRPRKYKDAAAMRAAVEAWMAEQEAKGEFPDEAGMILALGLKKRMIERYCSETENPEDWREYKDIFEDAKLEREHFLVTRMVKDNKLAQGCLNALKQPANGGYIDRPLDTGKVEVTLKVSGIGGMDKFG